MPRFPLFHKSGRFLCLREVGNRTPRFLRRRYPSSAQFICSCVAYRSARRPPCWIAVARIGISLRCDCCRQICASNWDKPKEKNRYHSLNHSPPMLWERINYRFCLFEIPSYLARVALLLVESSRTRRLSCSLCIS